MPAAAQCVGSTPVSTLTCCVTMGRAPEYLSLSLLLLQSRVQSTDVGTAFSLFFSFFTILSFRIPYMPVVPKTD